MNSVKKNKSFMQILNESGSTTEPCGTPCMSSAQELKLSKIFVFLPSIGKIV